MFLSFQALGMSYRRAILQVDRLENGTCSTVVPSGFHFFGSRALCCKGFIYSSPRFHRPEWLEQNAPRGLPHYIVKLLNLAFDYRTCQVALGHLPRKAMQAQNSGSNIGLRCSRAHT